VQNPHAYLRMYLGWKRWNKPECPVLPFTGGWEDWGLEETLVFEIIEDLITEEERRKERIESVIAKNKKQGPVARKPRSTPD
jgi:hypothetical protein